MTLSSFLFWLCVVVYCSGSENVDTVIGVDEVPKFGQKLDVEREMPKVKCFYQLFQVVDAQY